jgi:hypothetical protein
LRLGRGEGVEDRAFSDVGEANDSAVQWHVVLIPCGDTDYEAWVASWVSFIGYLFACGSVPAGRRGRLMYTR